MTLKELASSNKATITVPEAAEMLGCDPRTVSRGISNSTIPSIKLGRRTLIPVAPFLDLLGFKG
jgi:excisionase family DNA binding protein